MSRKPPAGPELTGMGPRPKAIAPVRPHNTDTESSPFPPILPRVTPGPARLVRALAPHEVKDHRHVLCPQYNRCLHDAMFWPGFSCQGCPLFNDGGVDDARMAYLDDAIARRRDVE